MIAQYFQSNSAASIFFGKSCDVSCRKRMMVGEETRDVISTRDAFRVKRFLITPSKTTSFFKAPVEVESVTRTISSQYTKPSA